MLLRSIASPNALVVKINGSGEAITVENHFGSSLSGLEQIRFADGTTWDRSQIAGNAWIGGTAAAETINGTSGDDTIVGGGGNDTLRGAAGSDTYVYARGDGSDIINESSGTSSDFDVLWLADLNAADVTLGRRAAAQQDLTVMVNATGEVITVQNHFSSNSFGVFSLEQIRFGDGPGLNAGRIA